LPKDDVRTINVRVKHTTVIFSLALFLAPGLIVACGSDHQDSPQVAATLDLTIEAIEKTDYPALWSLTDADSQAELLMIARELQRALGAVDGVYAAADVAIRDAARRQLGHAFVSGLDVDSAEAGPTLLSRLMHPERLRFDQQTRDGLDNRDITIDDAAVPARAIVHTSAGETLAFVRTPNGWRSLLVREFLRESATVAELRSNAARVLKAVTDTAQSKLASRDPRDPVGAYNLAVAAVEASPRDGATLYTLLDAPARAKLVEILQLSRDVQRQIQRRTKKNQRRGAYSKAAMTVYVGATTDRQLYERWSRSRDYLGPTGVAGPAKAIEGDPAAGLVTVRTVAGAGVRMVRDPAGIWHIAEQDAALDKALGTPVRRALR
jgi:hypothetical protein